MASNKSKFHGRRRPPVVEPEYAEEDLLPDPRFGSEFWVRWIQMTVELEHGAREAERRQSR